MLILQWLKRNEGLVIAGAVPGIAVSVTSIAIIYSIWVAALVVIVPFVVINGLIILTIIWPNVVRENCNDSTPADQLTDKAERSEVEYPAQLQRHLEIIKRVKKS